MVKKQASLASVDEVRMKDQAHAECLHPGAGQGKYRASAATKKHNCGDYNHPA